MKKFLFSSVLLLALGACFSLPVFAVTEKEFHVAMEQYLTCLPLKLVILEQQEISISNEELCLATIYAATGMKPLWVSEHGPQQKAADILHFLANAEKEGLNSSDYNIVKIKALWQSDNLENLAQLDTLLTLGLIKYTHDVSHGRIVPYQNDPQLFAEAGNKHFKPVQTVKQALAAPDLARYLAGLPPSHRYYRELRKALQRYRNIDQTVDWEPIDGGKTLHPGDRDKRIRQVRNRLAATGEYDLSTENELLYDEQLVKVIKEYQKEYRLEEDGIIGKNTLAVLNMTPENKLNTIIINMARWRWHEHELGQRYLMVNIAGYDLTAVEDGQEILKMAVIVGQFRHQTPVFSDRIEYIELNPYWKIPLTIARDEELYELRRDPYHLVNRNIRLLSSWYDDAVEFDSTAIDWHAVGPREMNRYRLRQDPGPWNALGQIKFVLPNTYDVYLHDTPDQDLFERTARTFSHGCIRVSNPLSLAEFVLKGEKKEWSTDQINEVVESAERKIITLSVPLPVHIIYQTVGVDNQGKIHFNNDNYGRDKKLAEILFNQESNETHSKKMLPENE